MPRLGGAVDLPQVNDPATPESGRQFLYFKSDGHLYTKTPAGTVTQLDAGSAPSNMVTTDTTQTGLTGDKTSSGAWKAGTLSSAGLTGATDVSRYVGATSSGAPSSGTFVIGDFVIDRAGRVWVCTIGGSPGTWLTAVDVTSAQTVAGVKTFSGGITLPAAGAATSGLQTRQSRVITLESTYWDGSASQTNSILVALVQGSTTPADHYVNAGSNVRSTGYFAATGHTSIESRFRGGLTGTAAPSSGTHTIGDFFVTRGGVIWICTASGTPGTWVNAGSPSNMVTTDSTQTGLTGDKTSSGIWTAGVLSSAGLTGATSASRYVGATATAAPSSGTFSTGDFVIGRNGHLFICTSGGSPGTWADAGIPSVTNYAPTGLTGATQASRYAGATTSGAPGSGTFSTGDFVIARDGKVWICTTGGTPGTWVESIPAFGSVTEQTSFGASSNNGSASTTARSDHEHGTPSETLPASTFAAKGDLISATANDTPAILSVGADGKKLVADSTASTGLKWADGYIDLFTTSDQAIQDAVAGTFVDVTGLSFSMAASTTYEIDAVLYYTVAATTTGHRWGFTGPGSGTASFFIEYMTSATVWATFVQNHNAASVAASMTTVTSSALAVVPNIVRLRGYIANGATSGTFKLRGASELNSASVTVKQGARMSYRVV